MVKVDKGAAKPADTTVTAAKKTKVMLGAGIKRYVLASATGGTLYEAGIEYPVTAEDRQTLFRLRDDNGVRVFYDADVIKDQMRAQNKKQRAQRAAAGDEDARLEIEQESLLDTAKGGNVSLEDETGDAVGVRT